MEYYLHKTQPLKKVSEYNNLLVALPLLGDLCKRQCDVKHLFNKEKRQACKLQCELQDLQKPKYQQFLNLPGLGGGDQAPSGAEEQPTDTPESNVGKYFLYGAVGLVVVLGGVFTVRYFMNKNKASA